MPVVCVDHRLRQPTKRGIFNMEIDNGVNVPDWSSIPTPIDDGAAAHLEGCLYRHVG
jgi:hypothetical protein